jgi:hypothetical protein
MSRALLIWVFAVWLAVGGCSARQAAAVNTTGEQADDNTADLNRFCRYPQWLDNYPMLKGVVYASTLLGLCAGGVLCLYSGVEEDGTRRVTPILRPPG